jgi:hypothetical protein
MTMPQGDASPEASGCGFLSADEIEAAIGSPLPAARREAFERHVADGCGRCALLAADLDVFAGVVRDGVLAAERDEFEAGRELLEARLRRAVREGAPARPRSRPLVPAWALAAAALLVAAVGIAVVLRPGAGAEQLRVALSDGSTATFEPFPFSAPPELRGEPSVPELWERAGRQYVGREWSAAAATFAEIGRVDPESVDAATYEGAAWLMAGKTDEAAVALDDAARLAAELDLPQSGILWLQALQALAVGDEAAARRKLSAAAATGGLYAERARELAARLGK